MHAKWVLFSFFLAVSSCAIYFTVHDIVRSQPAGGVRIVERYLLAVPIQVGDLSDFLGRTGWNLMAEDVVYDLRDSSREGLGIIVCSGKTKLGQDKFMFFSGSTVVDPPGSNLVVNALFSFDPKRGRYSYSNRDAESVIVGGP